MPTRPTSVNWALQSVLILGIHRGEYSPPPKKKSYSPKTYQVFFVFGPRIIHCYEKLTIKLLFNFNNFNSRLPASSQHHTKYFNPKRAHPCVIPRILSHNASKSVKAFDLCACLRKKNVKQKAFSFCGLRPTDPRPGALPLNPAGGRPVGTQRSGTMRQLPPRSSSFKLFWDTNKCNEKLYKKTKYGRKSRTNLLLLLYAYVPPICCNFVLYCSWQTYLRTYLLTYLLTSVVL